MRIVVSLCITICLLVSLNIALAQPLDVRYLTIDEYTTAKDHVVTVDVRSVNSRGTSKLIVPGAVWIDPHSGPALQDFIKTADKTKSYVIFCSCVDDGYSIRTAQILMKNGFDLVFVLQGGWDAIMSSDIDVMPLE